MKTTFGVSILKLVCFIVVFGGCSSQTKVHLFAVELRPTAVNQIKETLVNQGFELHINQQPFPESINNNAIIFAPAKNANQLVIELIEIVGGLGYEITSTNLIMQSNHSFSANNIGLYLLPDDYVAKEVEYKIPLVNEYGSRDCFHTSQLELQQDQKFLLTVNRWNSKQQDYIEQLHQGMWRENKKDIIELIHPTWQASLLFLRNESEINSNDGRRRVVSLLPQSSPENKQLKAVNCTYSISLII